MVLTCMEEAKRLVDKAYKEQRERWGASTACLGQGCPRLFREGTGSREFVGGGRVLCPSFSFCISGHKNIFKIMVPMALSLDNQDLCYVEKETAS